MSTTKEMKAAVGCLEEHEMFETDLIPQDEHSTIVQTNTVKSFMNATFQKNKNISLNSVCFDTKRGTLYIGSPLLLPHHTPPGVPNEHSRRIEFYDTWGRLSNPRNFIHYMLKYNLPDHLWHDELPVNYLSHTSEDILNRIPCEYEIVHLEFYTPVSLAQRIKNDWRIDMPYTTHMKLLLRRKT